ncbi:hypothetical protein B296_00000259 [Ensete ventricosum]|uniref:Uncharacterized protein n=1 Tax=Ensete ventricosum TaxID=4639 RepID=A0A427AM05_ENSVE|nr:hypothetical protein B296_00000259 [Ensete ventricosum]
MPSSSPATTASHHLPFPSFSSQPPPPQPSSRQSPLHRFTTTSSPTLPVLAIPPRPLLHPCIAIDPLLQQSQSQPKPSSAIPANRRPRCCLPSPPCKLLPLLLSALIAASPATHPSDLAVLVACRQPHDHQRSIQPQMCDHLSAIATSDIILYSSTSPSALLLLLSPTVVPVTNVSLALGHRSAIVANRCPAAIFLTFLPSLPIPSRISAASSFLPSYCRCH